MNDHEVFFCKEHNKFEFSCKNILYIICYDYKNNIPKMKECPGCGEKLEVEDK